MVDGKPMISCVTPVRFAAGKKILTIEGLANGANLHRVQQAFLDEGAMQCGYCVPGMVLRTVALLDSNPKPTEAQVIEALNGSLCRCCGYARIVAAVQKATGVSQVSSLGGGE